MISFDDFIKKYDGKGIDQDGAYGNQCMDLYHQYVKECLGLEHPTAPAAGDLWDKEYSDYIKVGNTPTGIPIKGDIIIWQKCTSLPYGHVAVFIEGTPNSFRSFDQNYPTGSLCHIQGHLYNNVVGWLHPKEYMQDDEMVIKKSVFEDLVSKASRYDSFVSAGYTSAAEITQLISDLRKSIIDKQAAGDSEKARADTLRKDFNDFIAMVAVALGTVQEVPQIKVRLDAVQKSLDELADLERNFAALQVGSGAKEEELNAEIARLKAMINNEDVLKNAKMEEILAEIVRRLKNILGRRG